MLVVFGRKAEADILYITVTVMKCNEIKSATKEHVQAQIQHSHRLLIYKYSFWVTGNPTTFNLTTIAGAQPRLVIYSVGSVQNRSTAANPLPRISARVPQDHKDCCRSGLCTTNYSARIWWCVHGEAEYR
jgi:hypothetical protein